LSYKAGYLTQHVDLQVHSFSSKQYN
jgi:hypothetical protein